MISCATATGWGSRNIGGSTVLTQGDTNDIYSIIHASPAPVGVVCEYGANDTCDTGNLTGSNSLAFLAAYTDMVNRLCAGLPSVPFYFVSVFPSSSNTSSVRGTKNTLIQNAITASGKSNAHYVSAEGWGLNIPGGDSTDGVHPYRSGSIKIANGLITATGLTIVQAMPTS